MLYIVSPFVINLWDSYIVSSVYIEESLEINEREKHYQNQGHL